MDIIKVALFTTPIKSFLDMLVISQQANGVGHAGFKTIERLTAGRVR